MLKRGFWLAIGAGFGFGMSFWTMRAVRRTVDKHLPPGVVDRIERALDALDGGIVAKGGRVPAMSDHPAVTGLRALAGGLSAAQDTIRALPNRGAGNQR
ncbi:MAG TPA: hypothetical protein VGS21_02005 [Acidimicrobiales bacterium]|nr:hypothetical protein [Acidimicrobiales bacterium]